VRSTPRCAARGPACVTVNSLWRRDSGTINCVVVSVVRTRTSPITLTAGHCDQSLRPSGGSARRSSGVGWTSSRMKERTGPKAGSSPCIFPMSWSKSSSESCRARIRNESVTSFALSSSSTHGVFGTRPQHCLHAGIERPSALQCKCPGQSSMEKSKSASVSIHRARMPCGCLKVRNHSRLWWSVRSIT